MKYLSNHERLMNGITKLGIFMAAAATLVVVAAAPVLATASLLIEVPALDNGVCCLGVDGVAEADLTRGLSLIDERD